MIKNQNRTLYSKHFQKQLKKAPLTIKEAFLKKRKLFLENSQSPQLRNHQLTGNYKGFRSINITGDWRALYSEMVDENDEKVIIFELLGTHSQLYR